MKPLDHWLHDANALDVLAYCRKHPSPLLVHDMTKYKLRPLENFAATMDRAVLAPARRGLPPSAIDDYVAFPLLAFGGDHTFNLVVGCGHDADIWIDDVTVSKVHAHITQDRHGNWYVQDVGSTTGTHVNDADPEPTQVLKSGDVISFGMVDVVFHLPASAYALVRRLV